MLHGRVPISLDGETGMLIAFAAKAGKTAEDGDTEHSPHTAALLGALLGGLDQPGLGQWHGLPLCTRAAQA